MTMDRDRLRNDYQNLSTSVGVVDLSARRSRVELGGDDRHAFLHNFSTNDIRNLPENRGCEAFLLNAKGHVLFFVNVWRRPESLVVESGGGRGAALVTHLDKYLIREKVTLADRSAEWGELLVAGPQAATAIADLPEGVFVMPTAWTREANFTVIGPTTTIERFRERLAAAGVPSCDFAALDALRIEAGFPLDGVDVTEKNLAQEVDRNEQTLHFRKGCYLGQETVARLDALGHVNKTLVIVQFAKLDPDVLTSAGTELTRDGQAVGQVTSAAYSPRLDATVALAYVKQGTNAPGTKLDSPCGPAETASPYLKAD